MVTGREDTDARERDAVAAALTKAFAAARPELAVTPGLGRALADAVAAAARAWPGVSLPAVRFVAALAPRLAADRPVEAALAELCTGDLYLACACVDGDPRALAQFDRLLVPIVERAAGRRGATTSQQTELQQIVRERLLMPRPSAPEESHARIAEYSGRGSLRAWIRVVATRETLRLLGRPQREVPGDDEAIAALMPADAGPEVEHLKQRYREAFKLAFREAVAALTDRERVLLRQHALDGLSIDRLADFYKVHRSTTARWVEGARRAVLEQTRRALGRRLHVAAAELDSIMRLIDSRLDITLPTLLREPGEAPGGPGRRRSG
ncbi:RNA polymerase sigma-70 factor, ECF subfamily [Nannocystis exedens]|uniref:RNA polymerase sigma-70 factor, ECF subfamily n=2 Tax=Nannocystis exedens TaxID=54 RepID=A0A1I2GXI8_9BACT|nr:transcriptional regulator [Nannocystis exedens]SFF21316.1 RNA polymerase sigma-70 factor, ECF subfamily [Nannocystis exedens]